MTKSFPLPAFSATAVAAGLLLVSGCRSSTVNSTPSFGTGSMGVPFYRSFERSPHPTDNSYDPSPALSPTPPPDVLPVPGYSEPDVPPSPSAQKARRNFLTSGFRRQTDVHQTGADADDQTANGSLRKKGIKYPTLRDDADTLKEEVVQTRTPSKSSGPMFPPATLNEQPAAGYASELPVVTPQRSARASRAGAAQPWPTGANKSTTNSSATIGYGSESHESSAGDSSVPFLLPPP